MNLRSVILAATALAGLGANSALAQPAPPPIPGGPPPRPAPFELLDTNRDGVVTRDEARASRNAAFDRIDSNRDGFIDRAEMEAEGQRARSAMREGRGQRGRSGERDGERSGERGDRPGERRTWQGIRRPTAEDFTRTDTNNDGTVTRAEWQTRYGNNEGATAIFGRMDANSDGQVTRAEFDAALQTSRSERRPDGRGGPDGPQERRGAQRPPSPDTNNDGRISRDEWLAQVDRLFERADTNRDGQITREEAQGAWRGGVRGR